VLAAWSGAALACAAPDGYGVVYRVTAPPGLAPSQEAAQVTGALAADAGMQPVSTPRRAGLGRGRTLLARFARPDGRLLLSAVRNADGSTDLFLLDLDGESEALDALAADLEARLRRALPAARVERVHAGPPGGSLSAP
jgi:hypothetical protein